jgi:hypothetical protein
LQQVSGPYGSGRRSGGSPPQEAGDTDDSFTFARNHEAIAAEAALDGIYVLRTSLPESALPTDNVVLRYKGLAELLGISDRNGYP